VRTSSSSSTDSNKKDQHPHMYEVCSWAYHLRMESVRLWYAQLPARGQSLKVGVWHLIAGGRHRADSIVSKYSIKRLQEGCIRPYTFNSSMSTAMG
jgi:hypothetical protein